MGIDSIVEHSKQPTQDLLLVWDQIKPTKDHVNKPLSDVNPTYGNSYLSWKIGSHFVVLQFFPKNQTPKSFSLDQGGHLQADVAQFIAMSLNHDQPMNRQVPAISSNTCWRQEKDLTA